MSKRDQSQPSSGEASDLGSESEVPAAEFLFVNRDQATISNTTRSHRVSSHVQLSHRRRSPEEQGTWNTTDSPEASSKLVKAPKRGGEIQPWRVDRPLREREDSRKSQSDLSIGPASLPEPRVFPMQRGNSDPFTALPITVDAVTNRILSWFRDDGLPAMFQLEKKLFGSSAPSVRRGWARTIEAVQSPDRAQSHIASVCALMAQRTESDVIQSLALRLKGKAYSTLRQRLGERQRRSDLDTRRMILEMFWAEQNTGNPAAAETHLKLLADWAREDVAPELDADFRIELLAADNIMAGAKMAMPLIDARAWAMEETVDAWRIELQDEDRAALASTFANLDNAVTDAGLQSTLFQLRELAGVAELALRGRFSSYSVFQWLMLRQLSCESVLLRSSLDSKASPLDKATTADQNFKENSCASLTALVWIYAMFVSGNRQQKPMLVSRLQEAQLRCGLADFGQAGSKTLALWSFHVGSLLEKKIQTETDRDAANAWQSRQFRTAAGIVCGGDRTSISNVLAKFLHSDILTQLDLSRGL